MDRKLALCAKIVHRFDDAESEVRLPEAVDRDARGQRIPTIHQPACEAETVLLPLRPRRGKHLRQPRRDFLPRNIVGPALEQKRVARRGAVGHHHHSWDLGKELLPLAPQRRQFIAGTPNLRRRLALQEIGSPLRGRFSRHDGCLLRSQRPLPNTHVGDRSGKSQTGPRADPQRRLRMMDRLRVLIEQHLHRHRLAVDINAHARRLALAVVRHGHVLPLMQRHRRRTLHSDSQVRPAPQDVHADFAIDQQKRMPHAFEIVLHVGHNRRVGGLRLNPRRHRERLHIVEVGDLAVTLQIMLAVEVLRSLARRPRALARARVAPRHLRRLSSGAEDQPFIRDPVTQRRGRRGAFPGTLRGTQLRLQAVETRLCRRDLPIQVG